MPSCRFDSPAKSALSDLPSARPFSCTFICSDLPFFEVSDNFHLLRPTSVQCPGRSLPRRLRCVRSPDPQACRARVRSHLLRSSGPSEYRTDLDPSHVVFNYSALGFYESQALKFGLWNLVRSRS